MTSFVKDKYIVHFAHLNNKNNEEIQLYISFKQI